MSTRIFFSDLQGEYVAPECDGCGALGAKDFAFERGYPAMCPKDWEERLVGNVRRMYCPSCKKAEGRQG